MSASKEITIQIVAALAAAGIIAWYSSKKNSQPWPENSANQQKGVSSQSGTIDDGSPGGVDTLSVNWGVSGAVSPVPISTVPISATNLPVTDPQSNQIPQQNLGTILGSPIPQPVYDPTLAGVTVQQYVSNPTSDPITAAYLAGGSF